MLSWGTYTVTGTGGKDVGPFQAGNAMADPLTVTSTIPATIPRGQDLVINWTGGGTEQVTITGGTSKAATGSTAANPISESWSFKCVTTGDKGTFTVPQSILQQVPAGRGSLGPYGFR